MSKVKNFFGKIWDWIKETAWFQVLIIVGLVIGVVLSISPITHAISNAIEDGKRVKYFEHNRITYDELIDKATKGEESFGVIFYKFSEDKDSNKDLQKGLYNYKDTYKNAKTVYALDIDCNKDSGNSHTDDSSYYEKYKISSAQLSGLGNAIAEAYNAQVGDINANQNEVKQELEKYEVSNTFPHIVENTLVWFDPAADTYEGFKNNFEGNDEETMSFAIKKVYTTIAYNRTDSDSLPVNNYMTGVARFFDQLDIDAE